MLTLKSVSMERAAVRVDTNEIDGKQRDLALPDFSMRNVGGGRGRPEAILGRALPTFWPKVTEGLSNIDVSELFR